MYIYIYVYVVYIYIIMRINKYMEMHVEKYLFKIIKEYTKNRNYKNI